MSSAQVKLSKMPKEHVLEQATVLCLFVECHSRWQWCFMREYESDRHSIWQGGINRQLVALKVTPGTQSHGIVN